MQYNENALLQVKAAVSRIVAKQRAHAKVIQDRQGRYWEQMATTTAQEAHTYIAEMPNDRYCRSRLCVSLIHIAERHPFRVKENGVWSQYTYPDDVYILAGPQGAHWHRTFPSN